MSWKPVGPWILIREVLLVLVLGGLLAFAFIPIPAGKTADPVGHQLGLLQSGSASQRSAAATELSRMVARAPQAIIPALNQAFDDKEAQVRLAVVNALHSNPLENSLAEQTISTLIRALGDPDPRVRAIAAGILSTLKPAPRLTIPALIAAANFEDGTLASARRDSGSFSGPTAAKDSIDRSQRDHARASAVAALGVIAPRDSEVQEALSRLAGDAVPEVRMAVARVLGEVGNGSAQALAAELKLASDPDLYIQARAITALGGYSSDYRLVCPILYRAYLSKQRPLHEGAELSLEKITSSKEFDPTLALTSGDPAQRLAACFSLDPHSEVGFLSLCRSLQDDDPGVRVMAVMRLGKASSDRAAIALKALECLDDDKDADVRNQMHYSRRLLTSK